MLLKAQFLERRQSIESLFKKDSNSNVTQQRGVGDRHLYAGRSRFIDEGTSQPFEVVGWPVVDRQTPAPARLHYP